jgi:hypothetical protein
LRQASKGNGVEQNRNSMKALTGILVVALAACSTPSEIVKTGPNAYRVRTDAGGGNPNDAEIKTRGIARANEFCDAQGKRAVINVGQSSAWHLFSIQTAEVQFFCDDRLPPRPASAISEAPAASAPAPSASAVSPARAASANSAP